MKKRSSPALLLIFALLVPAAGQNATPKQVERRTDDEDVVRITTNLIQLDAVVTDKSGRQVTDLRADEFEIQENGEEQKITNFSYVPLASAVTEPTIVTIPGDLNAPPAPPLAPTVIRPEQVRRTIALVIDDLGLSVESVFHVRRALKKFVDEQLQPGDFVAIMRTSGNLGILQQFTNDQVQLRAAVERVRWNPLGRAGVSPFASIESDDITIGGRPGATNDEGMNNASLDEFKNERFTVGTIGTLKYIVQGLKDLPGRKSVMLFSDGIKIHQEDGQSDRVLRGLRVLIDYASRSSVVIYTIDARGLPTLEFTAEDKLEGIGKQVVGKGARSSGISTNPLEAALLRRRMYFIDSQQGLNYLAEETGGLAFRNSNDLSGGLKRMLNDQQGYYLIGYHPNDETFDPTRLRFNKIKIKVKRSGLKVRYRSGFYGFAENESIATAPVSRAQQLVRAMSAPFASGGIDVNLTSLFANTAESGSYLSSNLHVDASKLTFTEEPDGWRKFVFDILAVTFGESGTVIDEINRTETVRLRGEAYRLIMENGFDYIITVPIKKPGAYQLRTALRDTVTELVGTASQFVEVPDLSRNNLALSGITVNGFDPAREKNNATNQNAPEPQTGSGVRRFRRGLILQYEYVIYNALIDKTNQRPNLQMQVRLFRDGKQEFAGSVTPYDPGAEIDMKRLNAGGRVHLGTEMSPGDYVLQIIVTDLLVKDKRRTVTKWIDFRVSDK